MSALKIDLYPDEVYCFTPKGDVLSLPRGATPLDFAYKIHTDLGHHCVGARVNGKLVPLKTALRNGDIVEILTSPSREPSRDWLSLVVTSRARSKIRHWLNTEQKKRAMEIGRRMLERELRKHKLSPKKILAGEKLAKYLVGEGLASNDDLFSRIGFGKLAPRAGARPGARRRAAGGRGRDSRARCARRSARCCRSAAHRSRCAARTIC